MITYSMDLRDRVVAACDAEEWTREEIADEFGVSTSWIRRLLQRRRETGDYGPKKTKRGRKPAFRSEALKRLDQLVEAQPDATLEELRDRCGVSCSLVTMFNTLNRLGYRRKKRRSGLLSKTGRT
jgi:transposase